MYSLEEKQSVSVKELLREDIRADDKLEPAESEHLYMLNSKMNNNLNILSRFSSSVVSNSENSKKHLVDNIYVKVNTKLVAIYIV